DSELCFKKKYFVPALQQLLVSYPGPPPPN
ncbi:unnamed protein product, partial [marine sediment metagenome]